MANPQIPVLSYARIPNVLGVVRCSENSDNFEQSGPDTGPFADVLMYIRQSASLIGESFGLENLSEAHIQTKTVTALCLPRGEETLGLLIAPTARPAEVVAKVAAIRGDA